MKMRNSIYVAAFALAALTFASCDKDENVQVSDEAQQAFDQKYPGIKPAWSKSKGYSVANFNDNGDNTEAWFSGGEWVMTEKDIPFAALPQAVKDSFAITTYAQWRVDDVDRVERKSMPVMFVIEVEKGEAEAALYYEENGHLLRTTNENDGKDDYLPGSNAADIESAVKAKYPNAVIYEMEFEKGFYEVEIFDDNKIKEAVFDEQRNWVRTTYDVRLNEVPTVVVNAIRSNYGGYEIDDVEFLENPNGAFYVFELEMNDRDVTVTVNLNGEIS